MPEEEIATETPAQQDDSLSNLSKNIAMICAYKGNAVRYIQSFADEEDPFHAVVAEQTNLRSEPDDGKTPLEVASLMGKNEMVKELIEREAEVNATNLKGYTALHLAAAWGKIDSMKILVSYGADIQMRTRHGERARETALRYGQTECVDYLDWAEAKAGLVDLITLMRETLADPEKVQGRLTKDDKSITQNACTEKSDWVEGTPDATTQDFIDKKRELDEVLAPIWDKLSEPIPEKPEKK